MDETPCYFDLPSQSTVEMKGEKSVPVATSGYEKMRFTTVLACAASGRKLKPLLIFKNLKNVPKLKQGMPNLLPCNDWLKTNSSY